MHMRACGFLFQAEDGIRGGRVTGVQTCALPICAGAAVGRDPLPRFDDALAHRVEVFAVIGVAIDVRHLESERLRSEERRVGKECRFGWPWRYCVRYGGVHLDDSFLCDISRLLCS